MADHQNYALGQLQLISAQLADFHHSLLPGLVSLILGTDDVFADT